ncbi:MAG: flagellar motor switch protein FliN [Candidatus Accumulibacter sp.]|jgi:flagellar motor switch protein FliN/FliY|nr:flagellar motor switch protein FliN [Accumulibacter sp.]
MAEETTNPPPEVGTDAPQAPPAAVEQEFPIEPKPAERQAAATGTSSNALDSLIGAPERPSAAPHTADIFPKFDRSSDKASIMNELDLILEIPVQVSVELGRVKVTIKNLLQLAHGSVIELDTLAGDPLSVYVNGTLIAQGEVVVVNEKFGIRLTDIVTPSERMKRIGH